MAQITLTIPDSDITRLLNFLKKLNPEITILSLEKKKDVTEMPTEKKKDDTFFELSGIWENSDVTLENIRNKTWPQKVL